jgi:SNF family Na+-dependent transporter
MNIINNYVNIYYIMIIGYSLYFIVLSFTELPDLPWQFCRKEWESKKNIF